MRGGLLAIGLLLLIIGIFVFYTANVALQEYEAVEELDIYGVPIGKTTKYLSEDYAEGYSTTQSMRLFGILTGCVGFILCIAGIAAPGKDHHRHIQPTHQYAQPPMKSTKTPDRICPNCGRVIPTDARLCSYCGRDFEKMNQIPGSKIYQQIKDFKESNKPEKPIKPDKADNVTDIQTTTETEGKTEMKEEEHLKFCPFCGEQLNELLKFCPFCGEQLER